MHFQFRHLLAAALVTVSLIAGYADDGDWLIMSASAPTHFKELSSGSIFPAGRSWPHIVRRPKAQPSLAALTACEGIRGNQ